MDLHHRYPRTADLQSAALLLCQGRLGRKTGFEPAIPFREQIHSLMHNAILLHPPWALSRQYPLRMSKPRPAVCRTAALPLS